ncbi:MAG: 50S ribosomal protein L24 [Mariniphaga sp.]|jgi:large subunit ribosomal protein L24|nr:50S ribosomal protein L24 [Mariniphaga sp.]
MQKKLHIKKGDTVIVISGNYRGQKGRVLEIVRKTDKAIVEGVNMIKKHSRPTTDYPQGGIIEKEAPIHISNLMLLDPKTGERTRVGRKLDESKGKLIRYSKKSGEEIK